MKTGLMVLAGMLAASSAFAANVTISLSGTYNGSAATTTYSAPNATWTLTFQVANPPSVSLPLGTEFRTTYTSGVYTLNGVPVPLTGTTVIFATNYAFNIFLDSIGQYQFSGLGAQLFTGTTSSPTMSVGSFAVNTVSLAKANIPGDGFVTSFSSNTTVAIVAAPAPTPLPPSVTLMMIAMAGIGMFEFWRRRSLA